MTGGGRTRWQGTSLRGTPRVVVGLGHVPMVAANLPPVRPSTAGGHSRPWRRHRVDVRFRRCGIGSRRVVSPVALARRDLAVS